MNRARCKFRGSLTTRVPLFLGFFEGGWGVEACFPFLPPHMHAACLFPPCRLWPPRFCLGHSHEHELECEKEVLFRVHQLRKCGLFRRQDRERGLGAGGTKEDQVACLRLLTTELKWSAAFFPRDTTSLRAKFSCWRTEVTFSNRAAISLLSWNCMPLRIYWNGRCFVTTQDFRFSGCGFSIGTGFLSKKTRTQKHFSESWVWRH